MNANVEIGVSGLEVLEARLAQDMAWLKIPAPAWTPTIEKDGQHVYDAIVIGAGMAGITASAMLLRYGIHDQVVYDEAAEGLEGPWLTYARMDTLRSAKDLVGPAMGLPALTFRAYYEARFGTEAWQGLVKIPRPLWAEYLLWLRKVLNIPVQNGVKVTNIQPRADGVVQVTRVQNGQVQTVLARHVVLANGRDGLGGPAVPAIAHHINKKYWAHSAEAIDFAALVGKRVIVVGGGASAMDNAATVLEAGAGRVDMLIRRKDLPRVHKFNGIKSMGVVHGFASLPDDWKWRFLGYVFDESTPPPGPSVLRVSKHADAHFHLGNSILEIKENADSVTIVTNSKTYQAEFIIFATGFKVDLAQRPELNAIADKIKFWSDRYMPPASLDLKSGALRELENTPDLGPSFQFLEKYPGACPGLERVHCYTYPAVTSHGKLSGDIPAISEGADRLARGIISELFVEDKEIHFHNLCTFSEPELTGSEWHDEG
ncbi:NAD(P)-binding domain-containing protein [Acetobacter tropicalis]|uniref:Oxidoreductase n=1 Tax=Acetobacter tropicalis NBRC 101654 TaxID=749388 RepID=F7VH83_9PROT|nr:MULTISPECIES: NAD(P)/FAD-dependent oxidoreductase [Acetobacter]MCG4254090.1 NAD(P)/FAD-dependent oxidoreductase [Acetobacter senegalensis]MCP1194281.1 NAD(P)/FAD-dependent oxidoreductase [Acetobacter senegalensis]GAA09728.1 oxidoreductase [Acetobacter tropicalis NBRC 101654]